MKTVEEVKSRLVCLVPKKEAIKSNSMLLSSHERTLCDCQVLEVIDTLETQLAQCNQLKEADNAALKRSESRLEEYRKLLERAKDWIGKNHTMPGYSELLSDLNALLEKK